MHNFYLHIHLIGYHYPFLLGDGTTAFASERAEKILQPEDIHPGDKIVPPFNAYSPAGDVSSQKLFYVNYGREEDFYWLKNNKSIDVNDSIVIARYGKIFRGDKVGRACSLRVIQVVWSFQICFNMLSGYHVSVSFLLYAFNILAIVWWYQGYLETFKFSKF